MKPIKRIAVTAGAVLFCGAAALTARILVDGGVFAQVKSVALSCRPIAVAAAAGDLAYDSESGILFAAFSGRHPSSRAASANDGIYTLALTGGGREFVRARGTPNSFHPRSIGLFRAADGSLTLMTIDRSADGKFAIDIFNVETADGNVRLTETADIRSDKLVSPGGIAPLAKDRFYVTNVRGSRTRFGAILEKYLALPRASILYFDGRVFRVAAADLLSARDIVLSGGGGKAYVTEPAGRRIETFDRDPFSGRLSPRNTFAIAAEPANIVAGGGDRLWIAAEAKPFAREEFADDPSRPSPTEIYRLSLTEGEPTSSTLVFADPGREIGAGSVAVPAGGRLFIGSDLDRKVLDCALP
jgi:hypothetical protein